jgi:hypothetical protein
MGNNVGKGRTENTFIYTTYHSFKKKFIQNQKIHSKSKKFIQNQKIHSKSKNTFKIKKFIQNQKNSFKKNSFKKFKKFIYTIFSPAESDELKPLLDSAKKSLPKDVVEAIKKGDLKPFIKHVQTLVTPDEIK